MIGVAITVLCLLPLCFSDPCTPKQWEGLSIGHFAVAPVEGEHKNDGPALFFVNRSESYDFTNSRYASREFIFNDIDGNFDHLRHYLLFSEGVEYWANPINQTCKGFKLPADTKMMELCIPSTAENLGNFSVAGLNVSMYHYGVPDRVENVTATWAGVIPVTYTSHGRNNDTYMFSSFQIVNVVGGIKDASVFDPPSYCKPPKFVSEQQKPRFGSIF